MPKYYTTLRARPGPEPHSPSNAQFSRKASPIRLVAAFYAIESLKISEAGRHAFSLRINTTMAKRTNQNGPASYSDRQLKTLTVLRRNQMQWIMFWFLLGVFAIILATLLYSAFSERGGALVKTSLILLDGIFGWSIKAVVAYLFPAHR